MIPLAKIAAPEGRSSADKARWRLILNGKVAGNPVVRAAVGALRGSGRVVEVRVTWEQGDAKRFTAEASADQFDLVVAGGGDGTVNEVVHGLMELPPERRPEFGIVPLGTANDFATGCGIPADPNQAFKLCAQGRAAAVDVGKANDRYFINAASGGFGATLTASTPPELKRLLGGAAYTLMGAILAARFKPYAGRLILPDREFSGASIVAIVANGRLTGGGKPVAPRALLDDGLLDVLVIGAISAANFTQALRELLSLSPDGEFISYWQVPWVEFRPDQPIPLNLDGEPASLDSPRFEAVTGALRLVVPANCALVRAAVQADG
jgi:lipid kinase YegS